MHTDMDKLLQHAYDHPDCGEVFYSANSAETASARLSALPWWDWTPDRKSVV